MTSDSQAPRHLDLVAKYFDENAEEWSSLYAEKKRAIDLLLSNRKAMAVGYVEAYVPDGGRVLDAGCGAGLTALELARRGYFIHGVDVAEKMLALCRAHFEREGIASDRYVFTNDDLTDDSLPASSFDGVVAMGFLQYQSDEAAALAGLRRLLRPDGILVVSGPNTGRKISNYLGLAGLYYRAKSLGRRLLRRPPRARPKFLLGAISRHSYTPRRFREILSGAGFEILHVKGHGFVGYEIIGRWMPNWMEIAAHRFFTGLARVLPIGRWGSDLVVVARKPG